MWYNVKKFVNWGQVILIRGNYHTHTFRCKHAFGDVDDYAKAAIHAGLKVLGISDHSPLPGNKWLEMRMDLRELPNYISTIDEAKKKYAQLTILKGMECEYLEENHSFFKDELLDKYKFDYLVASAHYFPYRGEWASGWVDINGKNELIAYSEYLVQMIKTGLFDFVAHPDMFGASYELWDSNAIACSKYIFEAAKEYNVALEINANGFRKGVVRMRNVKRYMYPLESFLAACFRIQSTCNSKF